MNRKLVTGGGLVVALALFLGINVISNQALTAWRLDVTENHLYTLSDGTVNILRALDEPVTVRLYYSAKQFAGVPQLLNYGKRVRDMLEEYAAASDGKLKLQVIDPEPFSEAEDEAVAFGVRALSLGAGGEVGYLGVVGTNATDDQQVLPLLSPEREDALEYELTKMVYTLGEPKKRVIGLISGLNVFAPPPDPMTGRATGQDWAAFVLLKELYDVRELSFSTDTIDDDIDTLVVVHPKDLPRATQYAIDQFVLHGGKALVFVDPMAEQDPAQPDPERPGVMPELGSDLAPLFDKWGITLSTGKVLGDPAAAVRVSFRGSRGTQEVEYLPWLQLQGDALNRDDFITNELNVVNVGTAGDLAVNEGSTLDHVPLIAIGPGAGLIDRDAVVFVQNPAGLLENFTPDDARHVIAMRISGIAETAFPDGRPLGEDEKRAPQDDAFLARSAEPINVIVVADTDILADRFWVRFNDFAGMRLPDPFANNADFLVNAVDNLGGNDDLISLRSRGKYTRPFEVVQQIQREAEAQFRDRERALQDRLAEAESKLAELQSENSDGEMLLTPEQKAEIERFRQEQVKTRKELRAVQHELRSNIERLGSVLIFLNTALVPIVIALVAIGASLVRGRGRRPA
ncbi:MAG: Gldg family protein [Gammaproteobacteria bacterium]|nr:Gldg family protein [Gammaproteobacteria bacterium]MCP5201725.1 Gldg family protein [Gammaproteobacteria bacterium]